MGKMPEAQNFLIPPRRNTSGSFIDLQILFDLLKGGLDYQRSLSI